MATRSTPCLLLRVARGDRDVVEEAEAHRPCRLGVMAGRAHARRRHWRRLPVITSSIAAHRAADAAHRRLEGARRHRGVGVELHQAARRRDVTQLGDVVLGGRARRDRDRHPAPARAPASGSSHRRALLDRAQAVRPLGMARRREVVEAGRVAEEKRAHQVGLTGNELSTSLGASGAKTQRKTQSMRSTANGKGLSRSAPV